MTEIRASACAKVILFGEHAAVYGYPVIALSIPNLRTEVVVREAEVSHGLVIKSPALDLKWALHSVDDEPTTPLLHLCKQLLTLAQSRVVPDVEIVISSAIPVASGLGSGAAVSVALVRAFSDYLGCYLDNDAMNDLVYQAERYFHGNPSGIDNTVIIFEKSVFFVRNQARQLLEVHPSLVFMVIDTGVPASTVASVASVRAGYLLQSDGFEQFGQAASEVTLAALPLLSQGDSAPLGAVMVQAHGLLQAVGVSHVLVDRLVFCLLEEQALGVKVSGGGQGGNVVALVTEEVFENLSRLSRYAGASSTLIASG
jgi:mevalonate kinase